MSPLSLPWLNVSWPRVTLIRDCLVTSYISTPLPSPLHLHGHPPPFPDWRSSGYGQTEERLPLAVSSMGHTHKKLPSYTSPCPSPPSLAERLLAMGHAHKTLIIHLHAPPPLPPECFLAMGCAHKRLPSYIIHLHPHPFSSWTSGHESRS